MLAGYQGRSYRLPLANYNLSGPATAFSLNATVPTTALGYLTLWPTGTAQPLVSTLNAVGDAIVANARDCAGRNRGRGVEFRDQRDGVDFGHQRLLRAVVARGNRLVSVSCWRSSRAPGRSAQSIEVKRAA